MIGIIDRPIFYLTVETSVGFVNNVIEIEKFNDYNLELINTEKVLTSDLPDDIPMGKIVGNLDIGRINFGNSYGVGYTGLDNYLDSYEFDGGTP